MISLRLWLVSLLLALPLYTYSLNHKPDRPLEDVFQKRDLEEVKQDIEKRQQIATDPEVLASVSSVLLSISDVVKSITENPDLFTANIDEIQASLSSVILSVSSDLFPILTDDNTPIRTTTSVDEASTTEPPIPTGTPGQVITDGTRTGTVGDDGTTRFCSASSYLCPASVEYGCCKDGYACGLTACTPSGVVNDPTSRTFGSFTATVDDSTPTVSDATFSFDPVTSKGGSATTSSASNSNNDGGDDDKGLSGGAIGGIVGGVVGGVALIAAGIVWFCLSKRKQTAQPDGPKATTGPTEAYTGGPIPPQPQMAQYAQQPDPRYQSPPPQHQAPTGYYQPQGQPQGGYPPYGQNVSELGGAAMPYGYKGVEQPQGVQEAPVNPISSPQSPPPHQENQAAGAYGGFKGPSGPVYELGN